MKKNIYNISASNSLVDVLAEKLLNEYQQSVKLTDVLILLPNRRACREMRDAFVRYRGMNPTLLPRMLPVGDVEEEEIFFSNLKVSQIPPSLSATERLMIFIRLITAKPIEFEIEKLSFSQACFLAQELSSLVDMVVNEGLDFHKLNNIVPEEYSAHWQKTLNFLKIITDYLPAILQERGVIDSAERRKLLLLSENEVWQNYPPKSKVIIAGTTATFPAMKELVKTISGLEQGEVYLQGLDKHLEEEAWAEIDESHPQFELKNLLEFLEISRFDVPDLAPSPNPERDILISEMMRPAKTTDKWRDIKPGLITKKAVEGLNIINCREIREEALAIALIMRQTLETAEKTAALVTTDRDLARRVSAELRRWNLTVDDSAGKPLSQTPLGIFLRLIAQVCETDFADIDFLSLLKHPFTSLGQMGSEIRKIARNYEKRVLRAKENTTDFDQFITEVKQKFRQLYDLLQQEKADFAELLRAHLYVAETVAASIEKTGAENLWLGDAGEAAANLLDDLLQNASTLGQIPKGQYLDLLQAIFSGVSVRPKYGTHPRLKILGPIEARLNRYDTIIIGEVNEGSMPDTASSGPWLSRPMKRDFGFPLPEKAIGILANDFSQLLASKEVYMTRAERVQGTPMVKSRWLMRLETVLNAVNIEISNLYSPYNRLADSLDKSAQYFPLSAPNPKPPLAVRPRELWAGAVENLMRDPYIIFAKYILKLKPLDEINQEPRAADLGNLVHQVLDEFNHKYPTNLPQNPLAEMEIIGNRVFEEYKLPEEIKAFWYPSFLKMINWLAEKEKAYRSEIFKVHSEVSGKYSFDAPGGKFTIAAKADRVDETLDGKLNIIDFKTGRARSKKEVKTGYAPQLPIEGIIARHGGFKGLNPKAVEKLIYWRLAKEEVIIEEDLEKILDDNLHNIQELIAKFDDENTAYLTQPNPKYAPVYSDYEHLSRIKEWGVVDNDE